MRTYCHVWYSDVGDSTNTYKNILVEFKIKDQVHFSLKNKLIKYVFDDNLRNSAYFLRSYMIDIERCVRMAKIAQL